MRGPKLLLLSVVLAAAACGRGPAGTEEVGPTNFEPAAASTTTAVPPSRPEGMAALDALPWAERIALEQALAENDPRYAPHLDETGPVLETPGSVVATFGASGASLSFGGHEATLRVAAIGRGDLLRPLRAGSTPDVVSAEVRTPRGPGVIEWWRSLPSGLEHGVTIAERPSGEGELWVEVAVTGSLSAHLISDDAVELRDAAGANVATYAHLVVLDATRARLPARMSMDGERIALAIDDEGARYPLVIDPLVTAAEATLLAPDGAAGDNFGWSVALSSDGSRALVGAIQDDTAGGVNAGSARVFLRTGSAWAQEATLLAPDGAASDNFGRSVALTSDGGRAVVGAPNDRPGTSGGYPGSARVFLRTGTTWAQEATLLAPDGANGDGFGSSVALTSDGSRALVGAIADDTAGGTDTGSARVFLRTGTAWAQEATLLAPDGAAGDGFGNSVALSSDGSRALVGATGDDVTIYADAGSARVFLRTGTAWAQEATLPAPDGGGGDLFGNSVALTSDGSRALVGAPHDRTASGVEAGSARVFLRTGTTWAQEATLLAPDGAAGDLFGWSVALTSDGSRALVAAHADDSAGGVNAGSARVFLRTGTAWAQEATLLAPDAAAGDYFGMSVALTSDGGRALVGAERDTTAGGVGAGSAHVFTSALGPDGSTCATDTECVSGFCTDGVCCGTRCAGGASDCQACSATLTGGADGTCALLSAAVAPTFVCRASTDVCDVAESCTSTSALCPTDTLATASTVCRAATPACDVAETCTGTSAACPADAFAAPGTACRAPSAGSCEATAVCTGASTTCPANGPALAGVECGGVAASPCAAAALCTGSSTTCPPNGPAPAGTICRPVATACDQAETCDGASTACSATDRPAPGGTTCRASAGACDAAEVCDGVAFTCPGDALLPSGVACGGTGAGSCSSAGTCNGASASCPGATIFAAGTVCLAAAIGNVCDLDDVCNGTTDACPAVFAPATTSCGPAVIGVCDAPDHCAGTTAGCTAEYLSGTECRASNGACDPAEVCAGSAASCPPDSVHPAGTACRVASDPTCDLEEMCDGVATSCPLDVTTCTPRPDAGPRDGGAAVDAPAIGADAGPPPVAVAGCGCRASARDAPFGALLGLMLVLAARRCRAAQRLTT